MAGPFLVAGASQRTVAFVWSPRGCAVPDAPTTVGPLPGEPPAITSTKSPDFSVFGGSRRTTVAAAAEPAGLHAAELATTGTGFPRCEDGGGPTSSSKSPGRTEAQRTGVA